MGGVRDNRPRHPMTPQADLAAEGHETLTTVWNEGFPSTPRMGRDGTNATGGLPVSYPQSARAHIPSSTLCALKTSSRKNTVPILM